MRPPIRLVCPRCAWRYASVVNPDCEACAGEGLLAVARLVGVEPLVAARAATLDGVKREAKIAAGLVLADVAGSAGLREDPSSASFDARSAVGRKAGKLLLQLGLRTARPRKPVQRRTKAVIAAERAEMAERAERARRAREQMDTEYRKRRIDKQASEATLAAYRARHPEEFEETFESEQAMVVIGELPKVRVRGWCGG